MFNKSIWNLSDFFNALVNKAISYFIISPFFNLFFIFLKYKKCLKSLKWIKQFFFSEKCSNLFLNLYKNLRISYDLFNRYTSKF